MLLSFVLSGKAVAQKKASDAEYSVKKICSDSLIVKDGKYSYRMRVEDALKINQSYPIDKQVKRNEVIFKEMRK